MTRPHQTRPHQSEQTRFKAELFQKKLIHTKKHQIGCFFFSFSHSWRWLGINQNPGLVARTSLQAVGWMDGYFDFESLRLVQPTHVHRIVKSTDPQIKKLSYQQIWLCSIRSTRGCQGNRDVLVPGATCLVWSAALRVRASASWLQRCFPPRPVMSATGSSLALKPGLVQWDEAWGGGELHI